MADQKPAPAQDKIVTMFFQGDVKLGPEYLTHIDAKDWGIRLEGDWVFITGTDLKKYIKVSIPRERVKVIQWG